jgi:hypothetical protein
VAPVQLGRTAKVAADACRQAAALCHCQCSINTGAGTCCPSAGDSIISAVVSCSTCRLVYTLPHMAVARQLAVLACWEAAATAATSAPTCGCDRLHLTTCKTVSLDAHMPALSHAFLWGCSAWVCSHIWYSRHVHLVTVSCPSTQLQHICFTLLIHLLPPAVRRMRADLKYAAELSACLQGRGMFFCWVGLLPW